MSQLTINPERIALIIVDMQNDFLHPEGAYGRNNQTCAAIAALPQRVKPLADAAREANAWVVSTQFTLVPAKGGEPFISDHLRQMRPFLGRGDFAPGGFGQQLIDELQPADLIVEKVAFSAFYQSRLEWVLRRAGVDTLVFAGIVTNGGVASTVRDAHVRDFHNVVLRDGCAAFSEAAHDASIQSLGTIAEIATCEEAIAALRA